MTKEHAYAYEAGYQDGLNAQNTDTTEPRIEPLFYSCKFTVESESNDGGDFQRNMGGPHKRQCVTFTGSASTELYSALIHAIEKMVDE